MPFISAIVAAVSAIFAPIASFIGGLGLIGKALVTIGLNLAASAIAKAFAPKPKLPPGGVELDLQLGENVDRTVACGRCGHAGHLIYPNSYGNANEYLQQVFVLSDYPCTELSKIWIEGELVTLGTEDGTRGQPVTSGEYADRVWVRFVDGTQSLADDDLVAGANPTGRWTANHIGLGMAYVVVTMRYDREKLPGPVQVFFEFKGAKLYDWRKDSTVGGSGAHRWDDPATHEYSDNPIVIDYNYRRGFSVNGDLFCGMEMPASDLPLDRYTIAANICDEATDYGRRYVCSIQLNANTEHGENIEQLMKSCGGIVVDGVDGTWPIVGTAQTIVATLTDDDLIPGARVTFQRRRSMDQLVNAVSGTYPNPDNQWSPAGYETQVSAAALAVDRRSRDVPINFETVPVGEQAAQLAAIYLSENRFEATAQVTVRPRWQVLEPGDWIRWNSARYGDRVYMVADMTIAALDEEGPRNTILSLQERSGDIYDAVGVTLPPVPLGPAAPVYAAQLQDFAVTAVSGVGANSIVYPAIRASWSLPVDPTVTGAIIEYRVKAQPDVSYTRAVESTRTVVLLAEGVVSSTLYEVRHKLVTDPARTVAWTAWQEVTTSDTPMSDVVVGLGQVRDDVAETFASLSAQMDDLRARVTDIGNSISVGHASNYQTISRVGERVGNAEASITVEQDVRATEDAALAAQLVTIAASVDANAAQIQSEQVARADADEALALDISVVQASTASNAAAIMSEQTARVSGDAANASAITGVSADFNGRFADGLVQFETRAAPSGVDARFAVMLRAGTGDAFKEAGFYLDLRTVGGVQRSEFAVLADRFVVTDGTDDGLPLLYEGGQLVLDVARIKTAIFDQLQSANGKLVLKGSGTNASIEVFS